MAFSRLRGNKPVSEESRHSTDFYFLIFLLMGRKSARSKRIAALNDVFRQSFMGGKVFYTAGVQALNIPAVILDKVQKYADFNKDNDPYGEHDFGRFEVA